ncbi:MAG: ARMT1-like domain-containing protein [Candidatus Poribacteria bacterium]|nr:ARMT1-like domain-containing protein [Candidatus Poribacteria bacterium]
MNADLTYLRKTIEALLRCNLADAIGITDKAESENLITRFLHAVANRTDADSLERWINPQWVILAAGKGTRIDPSGRLSKTLDIWFGEQNTLQLSRSYLPGSRPHIIVINQQMAERVAKTTLPHADGVIPASALDGAAADRLFGPNAILCIQPEQPYGTGAALRAALPAVAQSDAEFIGVGFGDEPFLNQAIFVQTLISHFTAGADVTLCGKVPETVVDKGGLFFDNDGKFIGTKEWYDMTEMEKEEMWRRLERGEAYTNTGITLIRRNAAIDRIDRMQPHGSKSELHHVDLIRHCYEDGLKTHAHIYQEEIISGVNRWSNVLTGEVHLFAQARQQLARKGVRVDPAAQITVASEEIKIGHGCYLLGRVHLGEGVRLGNYCRLEDVVLLGSTTVGDLVGLKDVTATDTDFVSNPLATEVAAPLTGLAVRSRIEDSRFDRVKVGHSVDLKSVNASGIVIPAGISLRNKQLGVPQPSNLDQLALPGYRPGVFTFGEKRGLPDWEDLRRHVRSHSESELIARATRDPARRKAAINAVEDLLEMRKADGAYVTADLTAEEIWGCIFEMVTLHTGNPDPYYRDKRRARGTALNLLDEFSDCDWVTRMKLVIAANIIDYSSARVVAKLQENPDYFSLALREAIDAPLAIDCSDRFRLMVLQGEPKRLIWLIDNDGEAVFDLWLIQMLAERGHQITVVGKEGPASNDATLDDLRKLVRHPRFQTLQEKIAWGDVSLISSGSKTIGTNLYQATAEFANALLDADLVISKGQGNFYTTPGLRKDAFYLLLSKGVTAEHSTGVVADRSKVIDGLILAYVPGGTRLDQPLKEFCLSRGR